MTPEYRAEILALIDKTKNARFDTDKIHARDLLVSVAPELVAEIDALRDAIEFALRDLPDKAVDAQATLKAALA